MPITTLDNTVAAPLGATRETEKAEASVNIERQSLDREEALFPEAIAHILTPKRRRTAISAESLAAIRRHINKP